MKSQFSKKLRYNFDNTMSKGPVALIMWLGIISLIVIIIAAFIISIGGINPEESGALSFPEAAWQSLMRTLDAGTMGGDAGWPFRIIMLLVTMAGIFIVSTLIGVLSSGIEGRLDEMRKGRSEVLEEDYTLILGWSSKIFTIISELVLANENQKKPRIVILAHVDKVEMEDALKANIDTFKNTRVICRSGDTTNSTDLAIVNPAKAKSIIILGKEEVESDFEIIKTILAITNNPSRKTEPCHIVAEMSNAGNVEVAKMIAKDEVEIILTDDIIARLMVQTSRQSGLSVVYTELMDYGGDEIYFKEEFSLIGKTYREALFAYESSAVMGLKKDGKAVINPPMDTIITRHDEIVAISEDDDTLTPSGKSDVLLNNAIINDLKTGLERKKENILLLGWNPKIIKVIGELGNYIHAKSKIDIVANIPKPELLETHIKELSANVNLEYKQADTSNRKALESLNVFQYDYIMLFSYNLDDIQKSDSITLITLLHLRDMSERADKDLNVVSEMLDIKNRELAEITNADDFIVSDKMLSLLITQVSENKGLMRVFEDILDEKGSEIYMKPITDYIHADAGADFYTLIESAQRKGHTAIGYRIMKEQRDAGKTYGICINPLKSKTVKFAADDKLIVLAED